MLRHALCAAVVLTLGLGVARGEEFFGSIRKVENGKITVATNFDKEEKKFKDTKTLTVAKNAKILNAKFNKEEKKTEAGEALEGGLKNERFKNIGQFGIFAQIITNADGQVTEIRVFPPFKFKKKAD
jgi:hypothetical protein